MYSQLFVAVRNIDPVTFQKKILIIQCVIREYGAPSTDIMTRGLQLLFKGYESTIVCNAAMDDDNYYKEWARFCAEMKEVLIKGEEDGVSWLVQASDANSENIFGTNITYDEKLTPTQEEFSAYIKECIKNKIFYEYCNFGSDSLVEKYASDQLDLQERHDRDSDILYRKSNDPEYHEELDTIITNNKDPFLTVNSLFPFAANMDDLEDNQTYDYFEHLAEDAPEDPHSSDSDSEP